MLQNHQGQKLLKVVALSPKSYVCIQFPGSCIKTKKFSRVPMWDCPVHNDFSLAMSQFGWFNSQNILVFITVWVKMALW